MQVETNDLGQDHRDGLAKHDSLSLDATNTPPSDTETIDHGGVGVGADDGVGVEKAVAVKDDTREVLEIDLVNDTRAWRYDLEVVEGLGAPLKELESLTVTRELKLLVHVLGGGNTSRIDLHGVIDDEVDGAEWVDLCWVATETLHGITHRSEIDNSGHSTTIVKDSLSVR